MAVVNFSKARFASRLKDKLNDTDMSVVELCDKLKTSRQRVHSWLQAKQLPNAETLRQLCMIFDVSADYFLCIPFNKKG